MTYILGWKTQSAVYLAADAMVTGATNRIPEESSFGERHIRDGKNSVAERALKLVTVDDLAIAISGDMDVAKGMVVTLASSFRSRRDPYEALKQVVVSHSPRTNNRDASLIVAWRGDPEPRLFVFNADGKRAIQELPRNSVVQLGSIGTIHKAMTVALLEQLLQLESKSRHGHLAAVLGLLQSYGLQDYLPEKGVGGSFAGLIVDREAITWQPDLLYVLLAPGVSHHPCVGTCIREGLLAVVSTVADATRVFGTTLIDEIDLASWFSKWGKYLNAFLSARSFDYVLLLDTSKWVIVVIEMKRKLNSKALRFCDHLDQTVGVGQFELRRDVAALLQRTFSKPEPGARDIRFGYLPYEAPDDPV